MKYADGKQADIGGTTGIVGSIGVDGTPLQAVAAAVVATEVGDDITAGSKAPGCGDSGGGVGGGCGEGL